MELATIGKEMARATCPKKYCTTGSVVKEVISSTLSFVIVSVAAGLFLNKGGADITVSITVGVVFVLLGTLFMTVIINGQKKRWAQTYISVCEHGVTGICPLNGYKNKTFAISYKDINDVIVKGDRLLLKTTSEKINITIERTAEIANIINTNVNIYKENKI